MARRMLIDASHTEETRVVVVNNDALEAFDYESDNRKQLKGNIYLAKVTRVEPSLQAAFVDYGGNRHGFLAFNEIHPDYYRIPVSDRERLIAEGAELEESEEDENGAAVETVGGDESDEVVRPRLGSYRNYKIQEVIKRRQILLVQVVKEERGNKGAALTTYVSLAGRYCVLMPNTARGGGISRKIASTADRKRLKKILDGLEIPEGMAVIVRTAGAERTKAEITRDEAYLLKLWDDIRNLTLKSKAPDLIYEEANLIKRSIRDLYSKEISEVLVEGEDGYRLAKDFMRMLVPSHAKNVKSYKDASAPLFYQYGVEKQLDDVHDPVVRLKSGGYLVINPTEALVSIDVNSGKATRERHIEETALRTNQEAAEEVARQLRLRDLAGLIVIDFIDMEVSRNIHAVERCLKESMKYDRARIQVGRISPFGLLEMSRQRLRPSLTEASSEICAHCGGIGYVRTTEASALHALRAVEEEALRRSASNFALFVATPVALYILNKKRRALAQIESQHGLDVQIAADETLNPPAFRIERGEDAGKSKATPASEATPTKSESKEEDSSEKGAKSRRPRRRTRTSRTARAANSTPADLEVLEEKSADDTAEDVRSESPDDTREATDEAPRKRRRRGRRGGRRRSHRTSAEQKTETAEVASESTSESTGDGETADPSPEPDVADDAVADDAVADDAVADDAVADDAVADDAVADDAVADDAVADDAVADDAVADDADDAVADDAVADDAVATATDNSASESNEKRQPAKKPRPARRKPRVSAPKDDAKAGAKAGVSDDQGATAGDSEAIAAVGGNGDGELATDLPAEARVEAKGESATTDDSEPELPATPPVSAEAQDKPTRRGWWRRAVS